MAQCVLSLPRRLGHTCCITNWRCCTLSWGRGRYVERPCCRSRQPTAARGVTQAIAAAGPARVIDGGNPDQFEELHRRVLALSQQKSAEEEDVVRSGLEALRGFGPDRMQAAINTWLHKGEPEAVGVTAETRILMDKLDVHLLGRHGLLLEDLQAKLFDKSPHLLGSAQWVDTVKKELYADESFPLLNAPQASEPEVTKRRRQWAIERETTSMALKEFLEMQEEHAAQSRAAETHTRSRVWRRWAKALNEKLARKLEEDPEAEVLRDLEVTPEVMAAIACQNILNLMYLPARWPKSASEEVLEGLKMELEEKDLCCTFVQAAVAIGDAVLLESKWRAKTEAAPRKPPVGKQAVVRELRRMQADDGSKVQATMIGSLLVEELIESAYIEVQHVIPETGDTRKEMVPAFVHEVSRMSSKRLLGFIHLTPEAAAAMEIQEGNMLRVISPKHRPMVTLPLPWQPHLSQAEGSYFLHKVPMLRAFGDVTPLKLLEFYDCSRVCKVLDFLGAMPWRVNQDILRLIEQAWERDIGIAGIPPKEDPEMPELPEGFEELPEADQKQIRLDRWNATKFKNELKSERPTFLHKLKVAQGFQHQPVLYFPHSVDFRGRAYPVPPHLNHIGDDVCRGLLMFAEAKPLGERGYFWLKVNLANLLGKDKLPFADRVTYIDDSKDWILAVAKDPFKDGNIERWAKADDGPWQALARILELAKLWNSGADPAGFPSSLPIHLDGSCNGLQHYAALGRDPWGGKAVNLTPSDRPQDIYNEVLSLVIKKVHEDREQHLREVAEEHGQEEATPQACTSEGEEAQAAEVAEDKMKAACAQEQLDEMQQEEAHEEDNEDEGDADADGAANLDDDVAHVDAKLLKSEAEKLKRELLRKKQRAAAHQLVELQLLQRKVVKQTIMTIPYGVTAVGARAQVYKQLQEKVGDKITPNELSIMAGYLSGVTLKSIDEIFKSAMEIKRWFDKVSKIMNQRDLPISWMSPMGLAVVQPYKAKSIIMVRTKLQKLSISHRNCGRVDKCKQRMGFPPNFIHSLDSSHMMMTAEACKEENMAFAGVHDSFWTHAADGDKLQALIQDKFIELHSQPILQNLALDIKLQLGADAGLLPELPEQGEMDIQHLRGSQYMFD